MPLTNIKDVAKQVITFFEDSSTLPIPLDIINNYNYQIQMGVINHLLDYVSNTPILKYGKTNINCKMKYYYTILCFIICVLNNLYITTDKIHHNNIDKLINNRVLYKLSSAYNGNLLLHILDRIKYIKTTNVLNHYIIHTGCLGTFETFIWWVHFINNTNYNRQLIISHGLMERQLTVPVKNSEDKNVMFIDLLRSSVNIEELITKSIANSDNRVFKYLLNEYKINSKIINFTDELIKNILNILNTVTFDTKYILKRLKLLSEYVNIGHFFDYIISSYKFTNIHVIVTLHKFNYYYNKPHTFNNISIIVKNIYLKNINDEWYFKIDINNIIKLFKTPEEKEMTLLCILIIDEIQKNYIRKKIIFDKLNLIKKYDTIIHMIKWNHFEYLINSNTFIKNSLIYKHIINNIINTIASRAGAEGTTEWSYNKFTHELQHFTALQQDEIAFLRINKVLNILKRIIKRRYNLNLYIKLNKISPIILALKHRFNDLQFNHFIKKYPHILYELNNIYIIDNINSIYNYVLNSSHLLVSQNINVSYLVKIIEFYINDNTIYGIIDIDIPQTTYDERCRFLLNAHPETKYLQHNNKINIDSVDIKLYHKNIIDYVNKNTDNISFLWWPLMAYKYTISL
jgi:hypothetical protein